MNSRLTRFGTGAVDIPTHNSLAPRDPSEKTAETEKIWDKGSVSDVIGADTRRVSS